MLLLQLDLDLRRSNRNDASVEIVWRFADFLTDTGLKNADSRIIL